MAAVVVRHLGGASGDGDPPGGSGDGGTSITVRPSTPEDTPVAAAYDRQLQLHLRESPSFGGLPVRSDQDVLEEWREDEGDPQYTHFVAEHDGRIVGHLLLYRRPGGDLRVPPESIDLANALDRARRARLGRRGRAHRARDRAGRTSTATRS